MADEIPSNRLDRDSRYDAISLKEGQPFQETSCFWSDGNCERRYTRTSKVRLANFATLLYA